MSQQMISTEQMAEIYWNRMHKASIREVSLKLLGYSGANSSTKTYWLKVQEILTRKAK